MESQDQSLKPTPFSPRNFLRARRPERFSDSVRVEPASLSRLELEYHLDSLTSRSQETQFEDFARQLAEREICPNLIPHTGPTGGGDSKVDSETYPVAEALSDGWFVGNGDHAGKERWAFAMSAKKAWRAKARADIASIASTGRGYRKAFFLSNQFIRDKDRAAEEDALSAAFGMDVRILDRTWILDRVFTNRREDLAISTLRISARRSSELVKGPRDLKRERDLVRLEVAIEAALQGPPTLALVDDALETALLARNLERPRTDVDGRFVRAQNLATKHGTRHQIALAHYQQGWAAFWWHEDLEEFLRKYSDVEEVVRDTDNVTDAELLHNLWMLLATSARRGDIPEDRAAVELRTSELCSILERLAASTERPSVALQARALRALVDLAWAAPSINHNALRELRAVVDDSHGLIGFALLDLGTLVTELSDVFVGDAEFEALFDALADAIAARQGEVARARMLLKRGQAEMLAERPYDAIRTVGRVLGDLYKHESRPEMLAALLICGAAYERTGLYWASRGVLLHAASIAANEWWQDSTVHPALQRSANRLKWVELQPGRVPHVLAWHELERGARAALVAAGYPADGMTPDEHDFDAILGILLLRSDIWQLSKMTRLPHSLDRLDLSMSAAALTFALGDDEDFVVDGRTVTTAEQEDVFNRLASQPVAADLPLAPSLCVERTVVLQSVVLGCSVETTADSVRSCVAIAESIVAAIEALLATSVTAGILPLSPVFQIRVRRSDFVEFPFSFEFVSNGGSLGAEVRCPDFYPGGLIPEQQRALKASLADLVTGVLVRGFFVAGRTTIERLLGEERGLQRALDFTGSIGPIGNVLGGSPKLELGDWTSTSNPVVELRRREEWNAESRRKSPTAVALRSEGETLKTSDSGVLPRDDDFLATVKHSDIGFESVVHMQLWDAARWCAIGWAVLPESPVHPPWMVLGFEDKAAAAALLTQLVKDVGTRDEADRLRIVIVRGISARDPVHYRVLIGTNVNNLNARSVRTMMFRIHTMTPSTSTNLDSFLKSFARVGSFLLGVGSVDKLAPAPPKPMQHGYVLKKQLVVRNAWEIGRHDIDVAGVLVDDDVAIPDERKEDAPVLELMKWKRELQRRSADDRAANDETE